jgi:hypothetical protein
MVVAQYTARRIPVFHFRCFVHRPFPERLCVAEMGVKFEHVVAYAARVVFRCTLFLHDGHSCAEPFQNSLVVREKDAAVDPCFVVRYRRMVRLLPSFRVVEPSLFDDFCHDGTYSLPRILP